MFDDIYKDFRLSMSERLSSPLMTSFVISWLIWNYRFVLIVLSSESIDEKLFFIDKEIFFGLHYFLGNGLLYPFLSSLFYVFIYPYPAKWAYQFYRNNQKKLLDIRRKIENETPMTFDEYESAKINLERIRREVSAIVESKDVEIEKLNEIIKNKNKELYDIRIRFEPEVEEKYKDVFKSILNKIDEFDGKVVKSEIDKLFGMSKIEAEFYLQEMIRIGLIRVLADTILGVEFIHLEQRGRRLLVEDRESIV